jgi:hypothetical protein
MNKEKIENNKKEFISILRSTKREGIENLINWLENKSDFFNAPSSTIYHCNYPGGLCQHSLNVYYAAKSFFETYKQLALPEKKLENIKEGNIIISALLHDLCKANFYTPVEKFTKDEKGAWIKYYSYKIEEKLPLGHEPKSIFIAQTFIKLTGEELCAIMWHMAMSDVGHWLSNYQKPSMQTSFDRIPLSVLIAQADFFASYCMEKEIDQTVENRII